MSTSADRPSRKATVGTSGLVCCVLFIAARGLRPTLDGVKKFSRCFFRWRVGITTAPAKRLPVRRSQNSRE